MKTVILAGGFARRLWPITLDRPKPLLPVAGKPILDHIIGRCPWSEPLFISINRRFADQFEQWAKAKGRAVEFIVEETRSEEEKLGSIGALAFLIDKLSLDDDLLVIGGDNLFLFDLNAFIGSFSGRALVALYDLGDLRRARRRYGVAMVEGNRVVEFQEKPEKPHSSLVSTACYLFPRRVLPLIKEFRGRYDAPGYFLQWLLEREPIDAFVFREGWFDVGDREAYIQANLYFNGGESWVAPEALVVESSLAQSVILGPCRIERSRLFGCVVDEDVELVGVRLKNALVGRGTRLRSD